MAPITPATPANPTAQAARWIDRLLQQLPELVAELAPGRPAPAHRLASPPSTGHGTAPIRVHVSDALRDITDGVFELEEAVCDRLGLPRPHRASVPERLRRIAALLDGIAADPVLAAHVRDESRRLARRCARALGDTETVVRVSGRCPRCDSVSLRDFPERGAVLCVNPGCPAGPERRQGRDEAVPGALAAREVGVAPATVRKWVQLGRLQVAGRAGRARLFRLEDVFAAERAARSGSRGRGDSGDAP
ncbi:hypothetical protein ACWD5F_42815 [Streptomyces sp. NPDC002499]